MNAPYDDDADKIDALALDVMSKRLESMIALSKETGASIDKGNLCFSLAVMSVLQALVMTLGTNKEEFGVPFCKSLKKWIVFAADGVHENIVKDRDMKLPPKAEAAFTGTVEFYKRSIDILIEGLGDTPNKKKRKKKRS